MAATRGVEETMLDRVTSFEADLRVSLRPVLTILAVAGIALLLFSSVFPGLEAQSQYGALAVAVLLFCLVTGLLETWQPLLARWAVIAGLFAVTYLLERWLRLPGVLVLAGLSPALAASLISFPAAALAAAGELIVIGVSAASASIGLDVSVAALAAVGILGALGVVYALYRPVHQLGVWLEEYFDRAQRLVEEARDRRARLEEALDNLATANRQLALANERMAALRQIAEEAQRARTAFVANVSHEFRTPLNMIVGLVDIMIENP
ncbi:MAG: hypothetical protein GX601_08880, partial [Anaerolineales bacterium]|nr:hypothetical protein [Anaerolineales bacterium]